MKKFPTIVFGLILLILFAIGAAQIYANKRAEEEFKKLISAEGLEGKVSYQGVSYSLLKGYTEVKGITVEDEKGKVYIEKLLIRSMEDNLYDVSVYGVRGNDPKYNEAMKDLGYEDSSINAHMRVSVDDQNKVFNLEYVTVEMPQLAITMSFRLKNLDTKTLKMLSELGDDQESINRASGIVARIELEDFKLVVKDEGFVSRVISAEAKKKGMSPEEFRKEMIKELQVGMSKEFSEPISKFIENGGNLVFSVNPSKPVPLSEVIFLAMMSAQTKDFSPLVKGLNIKAETGS